MAAGSVTDNDLGFKAVKAELEKLRHLAVKVGIVEGTGEKDGVSIAQYAAWNEVGTKHIPSRPFIRSWVDGGGDKIGKAMDAAYKGVLSGKKSAEDAMKLIGEFGQSGIRGNIRDGSFAPNAPATVKHKGSSHPLIDMGTLRNSIRYQVVGK